MNNEYKTGVLISKLIESVGPVLAILLIWGVVQQGQVDQVEEWLKVLIPLVAAFAAYRDRKGFEARQVKEAK